MNYLKKIIISGIILCLFLKCGNICVQANYSQSQQVANRDSVFKFLNQNLGLNTAAAAGIMGNMKQQGSFNPAAVSRTGAFVGICQWGGVRKTRLYNFCSQYGYGRESLQGQLFYLKWELTSKNPNGKKVKYQNGRYAETASGNGLYASCYSSLLGCANNETGARNAAMIFCRDFEAPNNLDTEYRRRCPYAAEFYNIYKGAVVTNTPVPTVTNKKADTMKNEVSKNRKVESVNIVEGDMKDDDNDNDSGEVWCLTPTPSPSVLPSSLPSPSPLPTKIFPSPTSLPLLQHKLNYFADLTDELLKRRAEVQNLIKNQNFWQILPIFKEILDNIKK